MAASCPCCVDVHTHVVPARFPEALGIAGWPSIAPADKPCHRRVMIDGSIYRTVTDTAGDAQLRLPEMDAMQVRAQVLSPMPELLSYWLPGEVASGLLRFINEDIASMVAREPARFFGLGGIPLQDMDAAISELEHVMGPLGLAGVEIAGNVNGVPIGDERFAPFWAACERLDASVFVHPLRPVGMDRLVGPKALQQLLAFPSETGLAAASLMTGGVLERHPRLRIALSHGGGSLASLLPRLQHGWKRMPKVRETMGVSPNELARRLYVDSLVYDTRTLRSLVESFGASQVLVGSDYPFNIREKDPVGMVREAGLPADTTELVLWKNALRWLGQTDFPSP